MDDQVVVARVGSLQETADHWEPCRVVAPDGTTVVAVAAFLADLQAAGRSVATLRSYALDLLRWFRFLWALGLPWEGAGRVEARDFSRWLQLRPYAPSVRAHSETVLRSFYEFHREEGGGPVLNPFPLDGRRRGGRANAHHNPMEPHRDERVGRYRPQVPARIPRAIPDRAFDDIFARLRSHRDRALVAFYVSTGARASELLSVTQGGVDPGRQVISVVRKGSGATQELPASADAFVWLRLYQIEMEGQAPTGGHLPLWWTRRRPLRPLTYHAAHRMFERVNQAAGASATLHALRHTAAYRMAEDPALPLSDVQAVLGHAQLATTQIYLTPRREDVIRRVLAHHADQRRQAAERRSPPPAPGYRPESLAVLFATGDR